MGQVIKSPEAQADLAEIWLYIAIAQDNQAAADEVLENINRKLLLLSDSPFIGRLREELAPALRSFPTGRYVLFYRPISNGIELVRVFHGARDIENLV